MTGSSRAGSRLARPALAGPALVGGLACLAAALGCVSRDQGRVEARQLPAARPVLAAELADGSVPRMLNEEPPFRYPSELYEQKVQGNVTLRLHVDSTGRVAAESTTIVASSGYPALDSAALRGAALLQFVPARRNGRAIGRSIRFPVHFRHPAAPPLPGDRP
jgi:periplasmic protein TonB